MAQSIYLFENVLSESILHNQEIGKLATARLGGADLSLLKTDKTDDLQIWLIDELDRSVRGDNAMVYLFKCLDSELLVANPDSKYKGDLKAFIITPKGQKHRMIVITCYWEDIFINNMLPVGVVADKDEIEKVINNL